MSKIKYVNIIFLSALVGCIPVKNEEVGMVAGGVAGGLLGSQIGSGSGQVAAAATGAFIGAVLGGKIGQYMDKQDQLEVQRALENSPTGKSVAWKNPDSGNRYRVTPTRTYYRNEQPCREYTTYANIGGKQEQIYGKACRKADGSWQVKN
ncbi:MAG: glycine zipper 2TM domain-containing protein [Gammaproteobacteria bacterium]|nr:glycine zipper 2TM domain-containing protein [Gammaproteobacteria bacterium]